MRKTNGFIGALMTTAALTCPGAAFAQEQSEASEVDDRDRNIIIVTARNQEENILTVPLALTAFDTEALENKNIQDLTDVARFTSGFAFETVAGGFSLPTIRGQAQLRIGALEQPVGTFLNGVYLPRAWMVNLGTNDLERIEIVKGPQSARYGRNAFAGAINYISPSADLDEIGGKASFTYGSDERLDAGGSISFPVVPGVLAVRAAYDHSEYDGSWENTHPNAGLINGPSFEGNAGGWDREAYSVSVLFEPTDGLRIEGRYFGFERADEPTAAYWLNSNQGDGNCGTFFDFGGAFPVAAPGGPRLFCGSFGVVADTIEMDPRAYGQRSDTDVVSLSVDWDVSEAFSVSYLFGSVKAVSEGRYATEADQVGCGGLFDANGPTSFAGTLCNFQGAPTGTLNYDSHELRINFDDGGPFSAGLGGFYSDGEDRPTAISINLPPGGTDNVFNDPNTTNGFANFIFGRALNETKSRGIFGEVGYALPNDATRISAELRYTSEKLTTSNLRNTPPTVFQETFKFWTPRVTVEHDIAPDWLLYGTVARGAKAGGFNGSAFNPDNIPFDPEFNWTYEVGTKSSFWNNRATVTAAAYMTKWTSMQITSADPDDPNAFSSTLTTNLGNASIYGIELEATVLATDNLTLDGTLSYLSSTFDDGTFDQQYTGFRFGFPPNCDGTVCDPNGDISGNDLPRTPSFMASFGAEWRSEYNADGDEFFIRGDASYQNGFFADTVNLASSPSRFLVNGRAGISYNDLALSIWVRNLTDKKYVSSSSAITQTGGANLFSAFYGERRTLGATAKYSF